jgi:peptidoglycan-N-acetylglucosamine deacetylase
VRVALTIDTEQRGRPADEGNPARLLDVLAATGTRATFFVQGRWAGASRDLARRIRDDGHLIGNHSYYHAPLNMLTPEGMRSTVERADIVILEVTGVDPRPWFRCPYGEGADDTQVLETLAALGYRNVGWDVDPEDWADGRSVDDVVETIVSGCAAHGDGARVLVHSWPDVTVAALPRVIAELRATGAELVRIDELGA